MDRINTLRVCRELYPHRIFLSISPLNAILNALLFFRDYTKNACFVTQGRICQERKFICIFHFIFHYHSRFSPDTFVPPPFAYREFLYIICYFQNNLKQREPRFVSLCSHLSRLFLRKFPSATVCVCVFARARARTRV